MLCAGLSSISMGLENMIPKVIMSMGCITGPIMLAAGLGLIDDCPAALIKANGGTGADKGDWGATFLGTTRVNVLILCGVCKCLTILDVWVLNVVPRLACLCFACMMGVIAHCHNEIGDDLPPPIVMGTMALITAATWPGAPAPSKKGKQGKKK